MTTAKKPTKAELRALAEAEALKAEGTRVPEPTAEGTQVPEPMAENARALLPLQLRIKNNGDATICFVSRITIPKKAEIVITYATTAKLNLARRNFAQMNAMAGFKRLEVEG